MNIEHKYKHMQRNWERQKPARVVHTGLLHDKDDDEDDNNDVDFRQIIIVCH